MLKKNHPFYLFEKFFSERRLELNFSRYLYQPDSILDERSCFMLDSNFLSAEKISEQIDVLDSNEELAFHSLFYDVKAKRKYHIPMIDFSISKWDSDLQFRLAHILPRSIFNELAIFESGRSFHGYSLNKITHDEWIDFMGRLLLINPPGVCYIDTRWIGHRLMAGYSALRWSCTTKQYLSEPRFLGFAPMM
ncbi:hypothetical protein NT239_15575 [Chitinibacter sp. SCUT-21]|uniref:primase 1D-like protein n=1 Tax=Chitinibacter sp. SCUT-21 TaxID=2970891 RepID=UPI0035A7178A